MSCRLGPECDTPVGERCTDPLCGNYESSAQHNDRLALELIARAFAIQAAAQLASTRKGVCQAADALTRYILTGAHPE